MSMHRANKDKNFTVISNYHLQDKKLSLRAKGLLSLMLSLPDEWEYSINGLVSICKESEKTVEKALKELKDLGYLEVIKIPPNQSKTGRFEYSYEIFEKPKKQEGKKQGVEFGSMEKQEGKKQGVEILGVEKQGLEFYPQLNTKQLNTKRKNTKQLNTNKKELSELEQTVIEFEKMRKLIKAPLTPKAKELMLKKLDKLASTDAEKIEILNQSIENSWKGIFPLRQENGYNTSRSNKVEMPDYMKKQEKGEIVSTPVNEETLAKALELQRQFKEK